MPPSPPLPPFPLPKLPTNIKIKSGGSRSSISRILHSLSTLTSSLLLPSLLSHLPPSISLFNSLISSSSSAIPHLPLLIFSHFRTRGISPNRFTFPPLLSRSSLITNTSNALLLSLHSLILRSGLSADPFISNSLLHLYSSSHLPSSLLLFHHLPRLQGDVVSWTILIRSHSAVGLHHDALLLFGKMHCAGIRPNRVTAICALSACAALTAIDTGVWIHRCLVERSGWAIDVVLGTVLVHMYGKCGRADEAVRVFEMMEGVRNVYAWNALIGGLGGKEAVEWFGRMEEEGVCPDAVTLIAVLRACSCSGMVDAGKRLFDLIVKGRYGFGPDIKHYGCMVDLLGRVGFLEEAMELVEGMPFEPGVVMWGSLLGGCRAHGNLRMGEIAAKKLVELEPGKVAHYVVLSNLYAEMGRWRDAEELRSVMKERGLRKDAGYSFSEVDMVENTQQEACG